jgi:hypothetical protein
MALQLYKIATVEVGSAGASAIDFTSIPQGYTDLKLVISARTTTDDYITVKFNGSSANFTTRHLYGTGSASASNNDTLGIVGNATGGTYTANAFASLDVYIPNYAGSTNKSFSADGVTENNATFALTTLRANLWTNTAAINQITIVSLTPYNFVQYTTATLYGIL